MSKPSIWDAATLKVSQAIGRIGKDCPQHNSPLVQVSGSFKS